VLKIYILKKSFFKITHTGRIALLQYNPDVKLEKGLESSRMTAGADVPEAKQTNRTNGSSHVRMLRVYEGGGVF
jgi:hypothetical protein